jgi:hypothetical protein
MNISKRLNKYEGYSGIYKSVGFEIKFLEGDSDRNSLIPYSDGHWVYYIFICLGNLPNRVNPETFWLPNDYCYYEHEILNEIYFYGGITYYHKTCGFDDGQEKIIKVGCDFNHGWDQDKYYTLVNIYVHVKKTIDSLYKLIPEYGSKGEINE